MSANLQIQISIIDKGQLGVLDAEDKVYLRSRDEYGQTVHLTKAMPLDRFLANSNEIFSQAFPRHSLLDPEYLSRMLPKWMLPKWRLVEGKTVGELAYKTDLDNLGGADLPNPQVAGIVVGWHSSKAPKAPTQEEIRQLQWEVDYIKWRVGRGPRP